MEDEIQKTWDALTDDQKIAATCIILKAATDHAREGGSFRHLIYDRLGFSIAEYVPVYLAGGMDFSNEVVCPALEEEDNANIKIALALIGQHADSRPMEPTGIKRDDGSDVEMPSQERNNWFNALWALAGAVEKLAVAQEVIDRQRAEIAALHP